MKTTNTEKPNPIIVAKICMIKLPPKRYADEHILKYLLPDIQANDITEPVILARKNSKHRWRVLDGLQRIITMIRLGRREIPAYKVEPVVTIHDFADTY